MPDKQSAVKPLKGKIVISGALSNECGLCIHFYPKKVVVQSDRLNAAEALKKNWVHMFGQEIYSL